MQLHNLKKNKANRKAKQVGRGGTRGKTSGRGTKGQNARSGRKKRPEMRDIIKRIPKLRGRGRNFLKTRHVKPTVLNMGTLNSHFKEGETVSLKVLLEKGLVTKFKGRTPKVKILAGGKTSKSFKFDGLKLSGKIKEQK